MASEVLGEGRGGVRLDLGLYLLVGRHAVEVERVQAREHDVKDDPQAPHVHGRRSWLGTLGVVVLEGLRRPVRRGSDVRLVRLAAGGALLPKDDGAPKVYQLEARIRLRQRSDREVTAKRVAKEGVFVMLERC